MNEPNGPIPLTLHIGLHKTGSTALQSFLSVNSERLARQGILYPRTYRDVLYGHHALAYALGVGHPRLRAGWTRDRLPSPDALRDELDRSGCRRVVLSTEVFGQPVPIPVLRELRERLGAFDVHILAYLRRQDHYIASLYAERVKAVLSDEHLDRSLPGRAPIDYCGILDAFGEVFGRDRLMIRPFERSQLTDGLFADFMGAIGGHMDETFEGPDEGGTNVSFSPEVTELLRFLNHHLSGRWRHYRIRQILMDRPDTQCKSPFGEISLSREQQRLVLDQARECNRKIAREFLGRSDGQLFQDPEPSAQEARGEYRLAKVREVLDSTLFAYLLGKQRFWARAKIRRCIDFFMRHVAYSPIEIRDVDLAPRPFEPLRVEVPEAMGSLDKVFLELRRTEGTRRRIRPPLLRPVSPQDPPWDRLATLGQAVLFARRPGAAGSGSTLEIDARHDERWQGRLIALGVRDRVTPAGQAGGAPRTGAST